MLDKVIESFDPNTLEFISCSRIEKSRVHTMVKHSHDFFEMFCFLDGKGLMNVNGKPLHIKLYDVILIPPGVYHEEYSDPFFREEGIFIRFQISTGVVFNSSCSLTDDTGKLCWLFKQIYEEALKKAEGHEDVVNHYLKNIMLLIQRHFKSERNKRVDVVNWCIHYMDSHYNEGINVDKLASMCSISPSYLFRLFKKSVGISPLKYLNQIRVEKAKMFLSEGSRTVAEVSSLAGYNDPLYFSRMFRKITEITPSGYRASFR